MTYKDLSDWALYLHSLDKKELAKIKKALKPKGNNMKKRASTARQDWLATIKGKRGTRNIAFYKTKLKDIKAEIDRVSVSGDKVVLEKVSYEKRRFWTVE